MPKLALLRHSDPEIALRHSRATGYNLYIIVFFRILFHGQVGSRGFLLAMSVPRDIGFQIPNFDWGAYTRFRPQYPESLFSRIFDHHKAHHNVWEVAHDAGSGAGIAAEELANEFDTVYVSDPNAEYLEVAKERLNRSETRAKFIFNQSTAEDQPWIPDKSLDMFTIFTAIGYADLDKLMQELSRVLKPGATFAAVNYNGWPAIVNNPAAVAAWMHFADLWLVKGIREGNIAAQRGFRVSWAGHDCIALPRPLFDDGVIRIKINEELRPEADQVRRLPELGFPPSRVLETDMVIGEENTDEWKRDYTIAELKHFVDTLAYIPQGYELDHLWKRIEQAMVDAQQRTLTLLWTVHIILATRRKF